MPAIPSSKQLINEWEERMKLKVRVARIIERNGEESPITRYQQYMPSNYAVIHAGAGNFVIVGVDVAGWTLDEYVIPRLASGLITAEEVTE